MGVNSQVPGVELSVESLDRDLESCSLKLEAEVADTPLEQLLIRTLLPGERAWNGGSLSQRFDVRIVKNASRAAKGSGRLWTRFRTKKRRRYA